MCRQKEEDNRIREKECRICPRNCGVVRSRRAGACHVTEGPDEVRLARAALHMWEEPCISGEEGSGTVFFTGCNLGCVFCQNVHIADGRDGAVRSVERLARIFLELQEKGANNINLVTPTHYIPQIVKALRLAKEQGLKLPIVYNTGSYETVEALRMLDGLVDIYLPDFKYMSPELAGRYSHAADYPVIAKAAIAEMVRQVGESVFDARGIMIKGVIVRHLVLPGAEEDSKRVIRYLHETYGERIYISIMNQYTPMAGIGDRFPELADPLDEAVYDEVVDYAIDIGVENGFIQEGGSASESFIPSFTLEGV